MKNLITSLFFVLIASVSIAQGPEITSWILNTTGQTGYAGIPSNIQIVQYSSANVYVSCTGIPSYTIGPWAGNPNVASNQNFVFKITRSPQQNIGTPVVVGLGHTGVWSNGVSIFNPKDAMSYNNQNIWHQNAYYFEGSGFDNCLGHPNQNGEYHHHVNPTCLYNDADSANHSPIIGYAFDGFPIYGAYAFSNTNGTGAIKRMQSSFRFRSITNRTTLPDGTVLTAGQYGPAINATYPLGSYIEDYEFVPGSGDLDIHNGRFCVTPDYPSGIYAYFVTIDTALDPVYPYTLGETYYGIVQAGNTGPGGGHNTISEPTTVYSPTGIKNPERNLVFQFAPNPVKNYASVFFDPGSENNIMAKIYDVQSRLITSFDYLQPSITYWFDFTNYPSGIYFLHLESTTQQAVQKIIKE